MGRRRRETQELLSKKLLAIREFVGQGQVEMASSLKSEIPPRNGRSYSIQGGSISKYENGRRQPNLIVLLAYAHLGKVHLELLVDNRFTLKTFQEQLGKHKLKKA
jgi:hypothetical protein